MFCDLVGSSALAQRLAAETYRRVVQAYHARAAEAIARYEGHVAQYLGDGLLVYFGYPQAHEDDAERAVRAGREILRELQLLNPRLEAEHGVRLQARDRDPHRPGGGRRDGRRGDSARRWRSATR